MGLKSQNPSLQYQTISPRLDKDGAFELRAVVETPAGCRHKYALEPKIGAFVLKETLASGLAWPYDYGFIPATLGDDGDPLDILVLMDNPTFPGCVLTVRLLGAVNVRKDGVENDRFIGCLTPQSEVSLSTDGYSDVSDLPPKLIAELQDFLRNYSEEKGHTVEIVGVCGREAAMRKVRKGKAAYDKAND